MLWSRYNHLFRSEGRGWLLYNALSNSFLALPEPFGEKFAELRAGDEFRCDDPGITLQLIAAKAVVDSGEDDRLRDVLRMKRRLADLSERMLLLTVAPTRSCNFACPYCFEANRAGIDMSRETEEQLVRFAERFQPGQLFGVTWFGGEPLLRFAQLRRLSERFLALDFRRYSASLITNGYLLDADKAALLDELAIREVQITLDGPEEVHDRRRTLVSGGGTFRRILENIDVLFASGWTGRLLLRVNVDRTNAEEYHRICEFLYGRYSDHAKRLHVYPASFMRWAGRIRIPRVSSMSMRRRISRSNSSAGTECGITRSTPAASFSTASPRGGTATWSVPRANFTSAGTISASRSGSSAISTRRSRGTMRCSRSGLRGSVR